MFSQRRASGRSPRHGNVERERVPTLKTYDSEEEKLTQPCFEGYLKGAWWEVDILQLRSDRFLVRYTHLTEAENSWLSLSQLRLRARKCDDWDCGVLHIGVDISVRTQHPRADILDFPTTKALYDAKIVGVKRYKHDLDCVCKFSVQFFCIKEESFAKHGARPLLRDLPPKVVHMGKLSMLQQPGIKPVHEVLRAHISGKYETDQGRWSHDALFLHEIELRIFFDRRGEERTITPDEVPSDIGSDQELAEPVVTSRTKNAHTLPDKIARKFSAQETTRVGSRIAESKGGDHHDYRTELKKTSAAPGMKDGDRGLKRKHASVDEKETSNLVQEDYSPVVSSRLTRSGGKIDRKKTSKNSCDKRHCKDKRHRHEAEQPVERKRGRRLKIVETESEQNVDGSQERLADSGDDSEREESNRGVANKRGAAEEAYTHEKDHTSAQEGRKASTSLPARSADTKVKQKEEVLLTTPLQEEKAGIKQVTSECLSPQEKVGRKRGRPKSTSKGSGACGNPESPLDCKSKLFKASGENANSQSPLECGGRPNESRASDPERPEDFLGKSVETEANDSGGPTTKSEAALNVKAVNQAAENDFDNEDALGNDAFKVLDSLTSEKQEKITPVKGTCKETQKKGIEKVGSDPSLAKRDPYLCPSSPNLEDFPTERSPQLRKLRPRPGKSKKNQTGAQTRISSKISSHRRDKDAGKEKGSVEQLRRPLYLDLLTNCSGEVITEKLSKVSPKVEEQTKIEFGLSETWDPFGGEDVLSDSEIKVPEEDSLIQKVLQEFIDLEVTPVSMDKVMEPPIQDNVPTGLQMGESHIKDEQEERKCQHSYSLKDDVGLVCGLCGLVSVPIEEMVPEVDIDQTRRRGVEFDDWDFLGSCSPDFIPESVPARNYDLFENGQEASMLDTCLPRHYAAAMHPHQRDGFEFLWRNLSYTDGYVTKRKVDKNSGCIVSHAPGTGKSFLIISFLKSYMDKFPGSQPLIVAPKIMLRGWDKEFKRWKSDIQVIILNTAREGGKRLLQKHEDSGLISLKNLHMSPRELVDNCRMAMLYEWQKKRSVCLVSYNLFSSLTDEGECQRSAEGARVRASLLDSTGLLILDEGHFPRNKDTRIRKALMKVRTHARILLSGTLFQNNFGELFNTLYLVRPGFVEAFSSSEGTELKENEENPNEDHLLMEKVTQAAEKQARKQFVDGIGMEILKGQMRQGSEDLQLGLQKLQSLTTDFVHHHTGEVLSSLPGLRDFAILLKPTPSQCALLELVDKKLQKPDDSLKREIAVSETSIHPNLLMRLEFIKVSGVLHFGKESKLGSLQFDPVAKFKDCKDPEEGVKTKFVFDLLRSLKSANEKVLIFSQHIIPLELLETMFKNAFNWDKKKEVLKLDGTLPLEERQSIIDEFNNPRSGARVLLASTKACGEGITLVGASRVVFMDVLWNPAVIRQAISRAFRLGQKKTVYVYRLIAQGTLEEKKYKKAIQKDWLSKAIFTPAVEQTENDEVQEIESEGCGEIGGSKRVSSAEEIHVWEVDENTCEDALLEELMKTDRNNAKAFVKVIEHDSDFHNRKTPCGPDCQTWFKEEWADKDPCTTRERKESEELGAEISDTEKVVAKLYQDFEEIGAFSSSCTDEEDL